MKLVTMAIRLSSFVPAPYIYPVDLVFPFRLPAYEGLVSRA